MSEIISNTAMCLFSRHYIYKDMLKDFLDIALTVQKRKKIIPSVARARARAGAGSRGKMSEIEPPQNPGLNYFLECDDRQCRTNSHIRVSFIQ